MKTFKNTGLIGGVSLIIILIINLSCANSLKEDIEINDPDLQNCMENDYPDCAVVGEIPLLFGEGVISTQYADFGITFMPDLSEIYFTRRGALSNSSLGVIMQMKKINGEWSQPEVAPFSGIYNDMEPILSPDGMKLIFGSNRPFDEGRSPGVFLQWVVERTTNGWSEPKPLGEPFMERFVMYPTLSASGNIYFTGEDGVYMSSFIGGVYQEPVKLGEGINSLTRAAHSYISPDESFLIFDAQPRGNLKSDLFISRKNPDGSWSEAIKLNDNINSADSQAIAMISPDNQFLFFVRNGEIYWVKVSSIEEQIVIRVSNESI